MNEVLAAAMALREVGLSVIPVLPGTTRSAMPWPLLLELSRHVVEFQPSDKQLSTWFSGEPMNVGVFLGMGPAFLACRAFHSWSDYDEWTRRHSGGWGNQPTVETGLGGVQVYARQTAIPRGCDFIHFRGSTLHLYGHHMVLPPSTGPVPGQRYQWVIPMPADWDQIPVLDDEMMDGEQLFNVGSPPMDVLALATPSAN